ncbi:MAG: hypothetical protein KGJ23_12190 [Euryarchaeota archaeon]|nr:hypothetical protein [Euryarchaeota archaeon]MDE1837356.1 hypothetical protein [Euryarchaeota archaeon]MDE1881374.1 hypothetical protein [Euryarchaeota archaeon]MDE2045634.1 hypothetical protein [Thermoplasmata archaeon]
MSASARSAPHAPDVNLSTVELVESLLRRAGVPVSRNWLLDELERRGHSTTRPRLNRALGYFFRLGMAVEGSKGVQWTHADSESLRRAVALGRRF